MIVHLSVTRHFPYVISRGSAKNGSSRQGKGDIRRYFSNIAYFVLKFTVPTEGSQDIVIHTKNIFIFIEMSATLAIGVSIK